MFQTFGMEGKKSPGEKTSLKEEERKKINEKQRNIRKNRMGRSKDMRIQGWREVEERSK